VEGGANALVVQPLSEIAGAVREKNGKLSGFAALRVSLDLLADVLKFAELLFRDKLLIVIVIVIEFLDRLNKRRKRLGLGLRLGKEPRKPFPLLAQAGSGLLWPI
jgi:hypothetical protein